MTHTIGCWNAIVPTRVRATFGAEQHGCSLIGSSQPLYFTLDYGTS